MVSDILLEESKSIMSLRLSASGHERTDIVTTTDLRPIKPSVALFASNFFSAMEIYEKDYLSQAGEDANWPQRKVVVVVASLLRSIRRKFLFHFTAKLKAAFVN